MIRFPKLVLAMITPEFCISNVLVAPKFREVAPIMAVLSVFINLPPLLILKLAAVGPFEEGPVVVEPFAIVSVLNAVAVEPPID
jgi:hypothetical protein